MISLTRLTGQRFALNPDLIERVEATPDTVITMVDGAKHVVIEPVDGVVEAVRQYRASILAISQRMEVAMAAEPDEQPSAEPRPLRLVHKGGEH